MIKQFTPNPEDPDIRNIFKRADWRPEHLELNRLWWKRPANVRILIYMDGASFNGGSFDGLQHVINAVESDPWPWANFIVTTANRYTDTQADQDNVTLTDLSLDAFDEVWLFGISSSSNLLSAAEVSALETFMDGGGGVLTTGDHASLGRGLSGPLKRVGKLRMYPAPPASAPTWNTTIRDANGDGQYLFAEQSDSTPQVIRPKYRYHWSSGGIFLSLKKSPHPLLCGEQGVLKILPDHQHEGQVVIPNSFPVSEWPKIGSFQPKPEIVAWGKIIDPNATNAGDEFPVIGAYNGHGVNVGRIVADSTWHHWFDINMNGFNVASDDYRDIISYFQNVAAWLAPKHKQAGMRNGVFWLALHENIIFEHKLSALPIYQLLPIVTDALGRWAPQCLTSGWLWEILPDRVFTEAFSFDPDGPELRQPLEELILAEAMADLQQHFKIQTGRLRPAEDFEIIEKALIEAAPRAATRLVKECKTNLNAITSVAGDLLPKTNRAKNKATSVTRKKTTVRKKASGAKKKSKRRTKK